MNDKNLEGHRQRLRVRFAADPNSLSEAEALELLLTYAIPRRDVARLAQTLIRDFSDARGVMSASMESLVEVEGIGESAAVLLKLVGQFTGFVGGKQTVKARVEMTKRPVSTGQVPSPFTLASEHSAAKATGNVGPYVNDEVTNALVFIPEAAKFSSIGAFRNYLIDKLPYNSISTRQRRANYILNRFYNDNGIDTPLTYVAAHCTTADLKPILFYHIARSEAMIARVAEEYVWPALPIGYVDRAGLRRFVLESQPDLSLSTQKNTLRSILVTYDLLGIGKREGDRLNLRTHAGTQASFLYVLTSEYPLPGMHTFEELEQGVMRKWLLWDKEWIREQLYDLRDAGFVAKVSEIDTMRQLTLGEDQMTLLRRFFSGA